MRVGFYQFDVKFGQAKANIAKVQKALAHIEADLMVLPELFSTGYLFGSAKEAEKAAEIYPDGQAVGGLCDVARGSGMTIVAGFLEKAEGRLYNSAAVVTPAGPAACYRKVHLFGDEKLLFTPGDTPFPVVDVGLAKIGVMICFDWFFPESARTLALRGAQIICHPSNLVMPYCPDAMLTRALENRVFAITADRIGQDASGGRSISFIGSSQIVTPAAKILHRASRDKEELFVCEIDPAEALDKNINRYNHALADRRPEFYADR